MKALTYARVSTREQGNSGLGLDAQKARCAAEIEARGWLPVSTVVEIASAASRQRPELEKAMRMLDQGIAEALIVSRLDRLSRSVGEFAVILERARKNGWKVVVLDPNVDMTDPFGDMMAYVAMAFAQLERHLISVRTKEGLAASRERNGGKKLGGLPLYEDRTQIDRIVRWRESGKSMKAIAETLTAAGVPSPAGKDVWNHKSIRRILTREGVK
jgi:DNA invertase Pin-like site-specific DNA recombinase